MPFWAPVAIAVLLVLDTGARAADPPAGARACSGCHLGPARAEPAMQPIAGRAVEDLVTAMAEFRSGARPATVMDRIAKGFSSDETRAIAEWYAGQK